MEQHTKILWQLVYELFTTEEISRFHVLFSKRIPKASAVLEYDDTILGPSMRRMNCMNTGRYAIDDSDIFRPLQYCAMNLLKRHGANWDDDAEWLARDLVEMSSAHIESLVKNIGNVFNLPLGAALRNALVKRKVDAETWQQIDRFTHIYNDSKHNFSHAKDTHLFSVEDAILAYFVCRKLGLKLYPLAELATDMIIFEKECGEAEKARITQQRHYPLDEGRGRRIDGTTQ